MLDTQRKKKFFIVLLCVERRTKGPFPHIKVMDRCVEGLAGERGNFSVRLNYWWRCSSSVGRGADASSHAHAPGKSGAKERRKQPPLAIPPFLSRPHAIMIEKSF